MILFREAETRDIPLIRELAYSIWASTYSDILSEEQRTYMLEMMYSTTSLNDQINQQKHHFLLALEDDQPVAFASWSDTAEKARYRLHKIYVLPSQQGKGLGESLINQVVGAIPFEGTAVLELNVNRHNKAISFYRRLGFNIIREEDIDIGNGYFMNDYVMQKQIGG